MNSNDTNRDSATRRDFLKATTVAAGAALVGSLTPAVHAAGSDQIKVGLIGCGGRGSGAGENVLNAAKGVTIHALGDVFKFQVDGARGRFEHFSRAKKKAKPRRKWATRSMSRAVASGLDAYKQVIDSGANYIILATPPGFRPHPPASGRRRRQEHLHREARRRRWPRHPQGAGSLRGGQEEGLAHRRRHAAPPSTRLPGDDEAHSRRRHRRHRRRPLLLDAGPSLWSMSPSCPSPEMTTDVAKQIWNWYNYTWLCGDHIVEQHVHNLDVINWAIGTHPEVPVGMGFRTAHRSEVRPHLRLLRHRLQVPQGRPHAEHVPANQQLHRRGRRASGRHQGHVPTSTPTTINGKALFTLKSEGATRSLRAGTHRPDREHPLRQAAQRAEAGGREHADGHHGPHVGVHRQGSSWEQALNSKEDMMPKDLTLDMSLRRSERLAIPGRTPLV